MKPLPYRWWRNADLWADFVFISFVSCATLLFLAAWCGWIRW